MPFARKTLDELKRAVAGDIAGQLPGSDALLRYSNLGIMGRVQAGMAHLHYGYLDWISKQAVPFTASEEFLEGWAALRGVYRQAPIAASGAVTFAGLPGTPIPAGASLVRGDGVNYVTTAAVVVGGDGTATVNAVAVADPSGQAGAFGNAASGVVVTLAQSIPGVQSSGTVSAAFIGGTDLEKDDSLRSRMQVAYQTPPQGGSKQDYEAWGKQAPGVTRAWCVPNGFGVGTVVVYAMMDVLRAASGGLPQGTQGVASAETRAAAATGDQLGIANYLYAIQPAMGLVYVAAPAQKAVNLTIQGVPANLQAAVTNAVSGVLLTQASPGGTVTYGDLWGAIANVMGGQYFTAVPAADIVCAAGQLAVPGVITFS